MALDVFRSVAAGIDLLFLLIALYQILYLERQFQQLTDIQVLNSTFEFPVPSDSSPSLGLAAAAVSAIPRSTLGTSPEVSIASLDLFYLPRFLATSSLFQMIAMITNVSYQADYSPTTHMISEVAYDLSTLSIYGCLFFLVRVTIQNASLAAEMVGESDAARNVRVRTILLGLFIYLSIACIVCEVLKGVLNCVSWGCIYLLSLAAVMVAMILIALRFLYKLYLHLDTIGSSATVSTSVADRVKPFMRFMIIACTCGAASAVFQTLKSVGYLLDFYNPIFVFFTPDRAGAFDAFTPILIVCYAIGTWYSWKKRASGEANAASATAEGGGGAPGVQRSPSLRRTPTLQKRPSTIPSGNQTLLDAHDGSTSSSVSASSRTRFASIDEQPDASSSSSSISTAAPNHSSISMPDSSVEALAQI